jgi:hypothetical protein
MQELFFELLRVAIGQMDCLSRGPLAEEWHRIYHVAQYHGLTEVCYRGVERLFDYGLRAPQDLSIDWMADAEAIRESKELLNSRREKLVRKLGERKIRAAVMNGAQSPSIDVFVDCSMDRAIKFARQTGQQEIRCGYTSLALNAWEGTSVNLHYRVLSVRNPWANGRMQKWFAQNKELMFSQGDNDIYVPTLTMNAICMLQTFQQRLLSGKATMSLLLDYYHVLSQLGGEFQPFKDGSDMANTLETLGLTQFAVGVMWVLQETLALDRKCMLCEPLAEEGRFILKELMAEERSWWDLVRHYPMEMMWPRR